MKLAAMASELERQFEDADTYSVLEFEDCIGPLVDSEWNWCQANKLAHYIKNAYFSATNATIDGMK